MIDKASVQTKTRSALLPAEKALANRSRIPPCNAAITSKSPSAGALSRVLDAPARAHAYAESGAAMISVLCDAKYFDGGWHHLETENGASCRYRSRAACVA